jgi:hypothetical protein
MRDPILEKEGIRFERTVKLLTSGQIRVKGRLVQEGCDSVQVVLTHRGCLLD